MVSKGWDVSKLESLTAKDFKYWYIETAKLHNYMNKAE